MVHVVAAVDLGGTNTKFGLITRDGKLLSKASVATDSSIGYEQFFENLIFEIDCLKKTLGNRVEIKGIGIGAPDANSINGKIHHASNLAWSGEIPVVDVVKALSRLETTLINDANAAAIGEMLFGAAQKMKNFIVITLGTGLGSGIVINGEVVLGHGSHAGELGHTTVFHGGRKCGCGKLGCLEAYVSAPGIVRTAEEVLVQSGQESCLRMLSREGLDAKKITDAAQKGDILALEVLDYTAKILGMKLAEFVAFSSPEAIFVTGGVANAGNVLLGPVKKHMEEHLMQIYKNRIKILPSSIAVQNAALFGAAASIWKKLDLGFEIADNKET